MVPRPDVSYTAIRVDIHEAERSRMSGQCSLSFLSQGFICRRMCIVQFSSLTFVDLDVLTYEASTMAAAY